jgi:hypothetical protein
VGFGISDPSYLHLEAIGKANTPASPYCVVNEIIAAEIGQRVRLPIPPYCVVTNGRGGKTLFASLSFNLTRKPLAPIRPADFAATFGEAIADILVFDAFICNSDRHVENLAADYKTARFNMFDHAHAVLGGQGQKLMGSARLEAMQNALVIDGGVGGRPHCLIDRVTDHRWFDKMLRRVEGIADYFLLELVSDVAEYGLTRQEVTDLTDFLLTRRSRLRGILAASNFGRPPGP